MSWNKDLRESVQPGTSVSAPAVDPVAEAELAAGYAVVTPPADQVHHLPDQASTSDNNVARARRRRDNLTPAVIAEAHKILMRELSAQARAPFRRVLAELIGARPTPEAVRRFADKYPDRWAQAVSIMGGLAGYERGVVEVNVFNIKGLSDADLDRRLAEVEAQLVAGASRGPQGPRVTGEVVDAEVVGSGSALASPASPAGHASSSNAEIPQSGGANAGVGKPPARDPDVPK